MENAESDFSVPKAKEAKVTIIGLGLMGGSLGLAIKKFHRGIEITGVDKDKSALKLAKERGAIDRGFENLEEGVKEAEFVFLACPIRVIINLLDELPSLLPARAIVTDIGSTKLEICKKANESFLKKETICFIGGHPMTGGATRGMEEANPLMFENAIYILTPSKDRERQISEESLKPFLEKLGAKVVYIEPAIHDKATAYVSHLPQLLAVALVNVVGEREELSPIYSLLAAGGFKDMTRIASSPFGMWQDIFQTNSVGIKEALDKFMGYLARAGEELETGELEKLFTKSVNFRESIPHRQKGLISPLHRISVFLPDCPGALAELTGVLAKEGLNIKDIELLRVRENFEGIFQVYFDSAKEAKRAAKVLNQAGFKSRVRE